MIATDGLYSTEELTSPIPVDTGTGIEHLVDDTGKHIDKPLGGWETTGLFDGLFICRPGIYFKLNDVKMKKVRSRGINAKDLIKKREEIIEHFERTNGLEPFRFDITRFYGMKTSVCRHDIGNQFGIDENFLYSKRDYYGRWGKFPQYMSFTPAPKRHEDFSLRGLPDPEFAPMSEVYSKFLLNINEKEDGVSNYADMMDEQPDGGLV
jgi:hypothetical protein